MGSLMLEALEAREAHRPRWEGGMLSASFGSVGITSASRPRSAITLWLAAPGLAPTGRVSLGRGNRRRSIRRSEVRPNHHSGQMACRGFEACGNLLSEDGAALAILVDPRPVPRAGVSSCLRLGGDPGAPLG